MLASTLDQLTCRAVDYLKNSGDLDFGMYLVSPDFIIGRKVIVEVDGGIHEFEYRQTPDRIRQRALENMGYRVYRIKNEQIEISPENVAEHILDLYSRITEEATTGEEKNPKKLKIQKITKPNYEPLPEILKTLSLSVLLQLTHN